MGFLDGLGGVYHWRLYLISSTSSPTTLFSSFWIPLYTWTDFFHHFISPFALIFLPLHKPKSNETNQLWPETWKTTSQKKTFSLKSNSLVSYLIRLMKTNQTHKTVIYVLKIDSPWLRIIRIHLYLLVCHQDLLVSFSLWSLQLPTLGFICLKLRVLKFPVLCWLPSLRTII